MDDEARIHVEPAAAAGGDGAIPGPGASSRRVVHEPSRRGRVAAVGVVAVLVIGGLVLSLGGGGTDDRPDEPPPPESPNDAYVAAVARLGEARTFAYRGEVRAAGRGTLRPGNRLDGEVHVEGAVLLPRSISREVAVTADGDRAVETVTVGPTAWSRTAPGRSGLAAVPWERVAWNEQVGSPPSAPNPESLGDRRLGVALLADVLRATEDRRPAPDDADGNRVLVATVRADSDSRERFGDLAGAEVVLAVDEAGDVTHLGLTSGPVDDPGVVVDLAIDQVGEPGLITPADVGRPARATVDVAELEGAGVHPFEVSRLPAGWALTDSHQGTIGPVVMCGTAGGCSGTTTESCTVLGLEYHDLAAVTGGDLWVSARSEGCFADSPGADPASAAGAGGEPFRAGRFSGWAVESPMDTNGTLSDGETMIEFRTDLSVADAGAVLATLVPFDATTEPAVLPGVPSS